MSRTWTYYPILFILLLFGMVYAQVESLPEPQQLLSPKNGTRIDKAELVFFWTSAVKLPGRQVIYELTLVSVNKGQQPMDAVSTNAPVHQKKMRRTFYEYPLDQAALQPGQIYAWRIRAVDEQERAIAQNDGYSQVFTLTWDTETPELTLYNPNITTDRIIMTGMRYQPITITTDRIMMVGMRSGNLQVFTETIKMTGMRYQPLAIRTDRVKMTGMRYTPKRIMTDGIKMTGMRGGEPPPDEPPPYEWVGPQINQMKTLIQQFVEEARAQREAAAVVKLNDVVALVDEMKMEAVSNSQTELEARIEQIQGMVKDLQTVYPVQGVGGETVVLSSTQTVDREKAVADIQVKVQTIVDQLNETQRGLPQVGQPDTVPLKR